MQSAAFEAALRAIDDLVRFHQEHGDALDDAGRRFRAREAAGQPHDIVLGEMAREIAAIYRAAGREAPGWTQPYLVDRRAAE